MTRFLPTRPHCAGRGWRPSRRRGGPGASFAPLRSDDAGGLIPAGLSLAAAEFMSVGVRTGRAIGLSLLFYAQAKVMTWAAPRHLSRVFRGATGPIRQRPVQRDDAGRGGSGATSAGRARLPRWRVRRVRPLPWLLWFTDVWPAVKRSGTHPRLTLATLATRSGAAAPVHSAGGRRSAVAGKRGRRGCDLPVGGEGGGAPPRGLAAAPAAGERGGLAGVSRAQSIHGHMCALYKRVDVGERLRGRQRSTRRRGPGAGRSPGQPA
jgi:hypothetical protein